jgi:hypothetical protein
MVGCVGADCAEGGGVCSLVPSSQPARRLQSTPAGSARSPQGNYSPPDGYWARMPPAQLRQSALTAPLGWPRTVLGWRADSSSFSDPSAAGFYRVRVPDTPLTTEPTPDIWDIPNETHDSRTVDDIVSESLAIMASGDVERTLGWVEASRKRVLALGRNDLAAVMQAAIDSLRKKRVVSSQDT